MKEFKDLRFKQHLLDEFGFQSIMDFPNDYGISVVRFEGSYGNGGGLFEVAVLYKGALTYDTPITDDVIGWLTPKKVTKVMEQVQTLK